MRGMILTKTKGGDGAEFHSKARQFGAYYGIPDIFPVDGVKSKDLFKLISGARGLSVFAYFGHGIEREKSPLDHDAKGSAHGMSSAHIWKHDIPDFVKALDHGIGANFRLLLYACSIGVSGGFASQISTKLGGRAKIFGHATAGHCTTNPNATYYPSPAGQEYVIPKDSPYWKHWCCKLKCDHKDKLWLQFPWMSRSEIEAVLRTWDPTKVIHHDKYCPYHDRHCLLEVKKPHAHHPHAGAVHAAHRS